MVLSIIKLPLMRLALLISQYSPPTNPQFLLMQPPTPSLPLILWKCFPMIGDTMILLIHPYIKPPSLPFTREEDEVVVGHLAVDTETL